MNSSDHSDLFPSLLAGLGRRCLRGVKRLGGFLIFVRQVAAQLPSALHNRQATARYLFLYANQSLLFVSVMLGFIGMILVTLGCVQAKRIFGEMSIVGPGFLQLTLREFAPTLAALILAGRVGASIAAEIGSMRVTEQLDALIMCGVKPLKTLVAPRVVACVVAMLACALCGGLTMYAAGGLVAYFKFGVLRATYVNTTLLGLPDAWIFLTKSLLFGFVVPIASARAGLMARPGSMGVGDAATTAVIESSLYVLFLDIAVGAFFYLILR